MSGHVLSWAYKQKVGSASAKAVLVKLADNSNDAGVCWPSIDTIAAETELNRATVLRKVREMEELGILSVEKARNGARQGFNRYHLNLEFQGRTTQPREKVQSRTQSLQSRTELVSGSHSATESTIEPRTEPSGEPSTRAPAREVIRLPLSKNGEEAIVTEAQLPEWREAYPGVDVEQELRSMRQWCIHNPTKRKTARGIGRFITSWLARRQDRGGGQPRMAAANDGPDWFDEKRVPF